MGEIRLLVCGSRKWENKASIRQWLINWQERAQARGDSLVVMHGAAKGADSIAEEQARELGIEVLPGFAADWAAHGKAAGPIRNQRMLDEGKPTHGLAFGPIRKPDGRLTGTGDMVARLLDAGLFVMCVGAKPVVE
jgi:hypothetical protein